MKSLIVPVLFLFLISCTSPNPNSKEENSYRNFIDSVNKFTKLKKHQVTTTFPLAEMEGSLIKEYKKYWEEVNLEKLDGLPQYQNYFDTLNSIINDINDITEQRGAKLPKLEKLRLKLINSKKYTEALSDFTTYGQLLYRDELQPACETALESLLNDPESLDIVDYNLKGQNKKGWVVVLKYRAKNGFGSKVLERATFTIQYDLVNKLWNVVDLK